MRLNAHVDVELVAVEQPDELTVLLELRAPDAPRAEPRPPAAVQVVLDRSGSMAGERLDAARRALTALVDRLDPSDAFGLVAFDDTARVIVPAGPVAEGAREAGDPRARPRRDDEPLGRAAARSARGAACRR
jgi:Ca-activated chloride channel family protein